MDASLPLKVRLTLSDPRADAVDRLLVAELAAARPPSAGRTPVAVVDDTSGALSLAVAQVTGAPVSVVCDSLRDEQRVRMAATEAELSGGGGAPTVRVRASLPDALADLHGDEHSARVAPGPVVVARLPKGLAALDELAATVAARAPVGATLLIGARDKFLAHSMTDVLMAHFRTVRASRGRQKCRALIAQDPLPTSLTHPHRHYHGDLDLTICAYGAAFAGTRVDAATRLLLSTFDQLPADPDRIIDLGCGTGVLAIMAARARPAAAVLALDTSRAAVLSARATAEANGLDDRVDVRRSDGLADEPDSSVDLIVCNPPFHHGTTKDTSTAFAMIEAAGRVLRPGGALWLVYNAHLPYLHALRRHIGPTQVIARDRAYLVTRSVRVPPGS